MIRRLLPMILAFFALAAAAGPDDRQPVLKGDLDRLIHDYIVSHPEVIAEAQKAMLERRAKDVVAANQAALTGDSADGEIGNPKGDVTIVEFFDNECPFCKLMAPALDQLAARDGNVRIVLKEFAILGPGSELAARYSLASLRQGRYAAFHAALMADKTPEHHLAEPHILELAAAVGLDVGKLKQDAQAPEIMDQINRTRTLGRAIGIAGTPGLVIGDTVLSGVLPYDALVKAVATVRAAKQADGSAH